MWQKNVYLGFCLKCRSVEVRLLGLAGILGCSGLDLEMSGVGFLPGSD